MREEAEAGSVADSTALPHPTFPEAVRVWCRVALLSFGGPAGQIAVMHRIAVDEKRWINEQQFLHALNYCMLLPGPEAQQLATYIGWLLHRTAGGLTAGLLFILPGFVSILALSVLYAGYSDVVLVQALFYGLKPAVIAVVLEAVLRIGRRALRHRLHVLIAAVAFIAIFFFQVPFPLIVLAAAATGFVGNHIFPGVFASPAPVPRPNPEPASVVPQLAAADRSPSIWRTVRVLLLWLAIWWLPVLGLHVLTGPNSIYSREARFFSQVAVVTFGGAYSVLSYITQECVHTHHWLEPGEMLDGLGMAETTPGPLIQVVQFVGFLGAYRHAGSLPPLLAGIFGSVVTTWVTFAPCFLWIFVGAPYIEHLRGRAGLNAALSSITAAVVGVILNLTIYFALHTLFEQVNVMHAWGLRMLLPDFSTLDLGALVIAAGASWALLRQHRGMGKTLAVSAAAGLLLYGFRVS